MGHCLTSYALQPYFDSAHTTVAGTSSKSAAVSSADLSGVTSVISSPSQKMKRNNEVHDEVGEGEGVCITETQSDTLVEGGWEKVIIEAVTSTRVTFPVRTDYSECRVSSWYSVGSSVSSLTFLCNRTVK